MECLRLAQRRALQQIFHTRPAHQSFRQLQQGPQQTFRTRSPTAARYATSRSTHKLSSKSFATAFRRAARSSKRFYSTATEAQDTSLSGRLRKLSREYGWSALGVYLLLSAADFPFCFLAVRLLGTDRIGHWEHVIVSWIKEAITWPMSGSVEEKVDDAADKVETVGKRMLEEVREGEQRLLEEDETYVVTDHGYRDAEKASGKPDATIWTQLALAYAIHKSFIFIRVPLTAAVTPKVVKTLRGWGWNIGKMPKRKGVGDSGKTGVNTKGSGVKPDN